MVKNILEQKFPRLRGTIYNIISPETADYNCIAWAAGDTERWWWPIPPSYWPLGVSLQETIESFIQAFVTLGFVPTDSDQLEPGFEKSNGASAC